jgi:chorismate mutase
MKTDLNSLRKEIDKIDREIINQLSKRIKIIKKIGDYKKRNKLRVYSPEREKEIITKIKKFAASKNINKALIEKIYKNILNQAREIQRKNVS